MKKCGADILNLLAWPRLVAGFLPWQPGFEPGSAHVGCIGQTGTGTGYPRVFRFLLPIIPPTAPHASSSIIRSWYTRPMYQVDSFSPYSKKLHTTSSTCVDKPSTSCDEAVNTGNTGTNDCSLNNGQRTNAKRGGYTSPARHSNSNTYRLNLKFGSKSYNLWGEFPDVGIKHKYSLKKEYKGKITHNL
jgi:hypothetical protein